jgi:hypothetical protein
MTGSNGMLDGLASGLVNQRKAGIPFFILHSCAVLFIFVPVLQISHTEKHIINNKPIWEKLR